VSNLPAVVIYAAVEFAPPQRRFLALWLDPLDDEPQTTPSVFGPSAARVRELLEAKLLDLRAKGTDLARVRPEGFDPQLGLRLRRRGRSGKRSLARA
jgi:hypothetical protein